MGQAPMESLVVVTPVFNDWEAVALVMADLDARLSGAGRTGRLVLVDDGSTMAMPAGFMAGPWKAIEEVRVLHLRLNVSHQRAIAVGLAHVHARMPGGPVVVMDGDGEDDPADVPRLVERVEAREGEGAPRVVFAERMERSEAWWFRASYAVYRRLHRALVGRHDRVGNYSAIPRAMLDRLVASGDLWNHYAAAVIRQRVAIDKVACRRQPRLAGQTKMRFLSLAVHGLSAISVNSDAVGMRLIVASLAGGVVFAGLLAASVAFAASGGGPGWRWAILGASLGVVIAGQALAASVLFGLLALRSRSHPEVVPSRDAEAYIREVRQMYPPV